MKKYLIKVKNWLKNNYLAVILLVFIGGIFIFKSNFMNNLSIESKWRTIFIARCKSSETELLGVMELAGKLDTTYYENDLHSSYNNMIYALKKKNKSLYESIKDYTVDYSYAPNLFNIIYWGNDTCKVLDKDGKDHYKEIIKEIR